MCFPERIARCQRHPGDRATGRAQAPEQDARSATKQGQPDDIEMLEGKASSGRPVLFQSAILREAIS